MARGDLRLLHTQRRQLPLGPALLHLLGVAHHVTMPQEKELCHRMTSCPCSHRVSSGQSSQRGWRAWQTRRPCVIRLR